MALYSNGFKKVIFHFKSFFYFENPKFNLKIFKYVQNYKKDPTFQKRYKQRNRY